MKKKIIIPILSMLLLLVTYIGLKSLTKTLSDVIIDINEDEDLEF
jgi:hypothetical protein